MEGGALCGTESGVTARCVFHGQLDICTTPSIGWNMFIKIDLWPHKVQVQIIEMTHKSPSPRVLSENRK